MGKPGAYLSIGRKEHDVRSAEDAIADFGDFTIDLSREEQRDQAPQGQAPQGQPFPDDGFDPYADEADA